MDGKLLSKIGKNNEFLMGLKLWVLYGGCEFWEWFYIEIRKVVGGFVV